MGMGSVRSKILRQEVQGRRWCGLDWFWPEWDRVWHRIHKGSAPRCSDVGIDGVGMGR